MKLVGEDPHRPCVTLRAQDLRVAADSTSTTLFRELGVASMRAPTHRIKRDTTPGTGLLVGLIWGATETHESPGALPDSIASRNR